MAAAAFLTLFFDFRPKIRKRHHLNQKYQLIELCQARRELLQSTEFQADWATIQKRFPLERLRDGAGILRRSPLPERYGQPLVYSDLRTIRDQFKVCFDVFCWKWFLYGMRSDGPLVDKLSVTFTPFGTQIAGRQQRQHELMRPREAEKIAKKKKGVRGPEHYAFLKKAAGLPEQTDDRQMRRLISFARFSKPS
jgi:hypothetical protein